MLLLPKDILIIGNDSHGIETAGKRTPKFEDGHIIRENEFNHPTNTIFLQACKEFGFATYDVSPERTDTPLETRTDRANKQYNLHKCKFYIYVTWHFNSMGSKWDDKTGGIETFYHDGSIEGKKLATAIHKQLLKGTNLKDRGVKKDTTIYKSGFHELRETIMPAVLLECGFMSNHVEANLMKNFQYQHECAVEALKGICDYFGLNYKEEQKKVSKLEEYAKIISPNYWQVWMKHFKASSKLNWEGFLHEALRKKLP
jgi:N-acetylmuramoyl-L-alanine amidase